jgi:hypothetical protein
VIKEDFNMTFLGILCAIWLLIYGATEKPRGHKAVVEQNKDWKKRGLKYDKKILNEE